MEHAELELLEDAKGTAHQVFLIATVLARTKPIFKLTAEHISQSKQMAEMFMFIFGWS